MPKAKTNGNGKLTITMAELLKTVGTPDPVNVLSAFQNLRKQPVPVSIGLKLIELGKVLSDKGHSYNQMLDDLRERHFHNGEADLEGFNNDVRELMDQKVELSFTKLPQAIISEAKLSTDDLQSLLWMFE